MKILKFQLKDFLEFILITGAVGYAIFAIYVITQSIKNHKPITIDLGKVTYLNHSMIKTTNNTTFARCRGFFDFNCIDIECMDIEVGCKLYKHETLTHTLYSCD